MENASRLAEHKINAGDIRTVTENKSKTGES
jgi:hypothetical protein